MRLTDLLPRLAVHTDRLLSTASALDDWQAPSLCTGWRRIDVLAHLARNAEGLQRLVRAIVTGSGETMYASDRQRDDDIATWAALPPAEVLDLLAATAGELAAALARLAPEHDAVSAERTPGGVLMPGRALPWLRLREVVYHHVDLLAGFTFENAEPELLQAFLDDELGRLGDEAPIARARALMWLARDRAIRTGVDGRELT